MAYNNYNNNNYNNNFNNGGYNNNNGVNNANGEYRNSGMGEMADISIIGRISSDIQEKEINSGKVVNYSVARNYRRGENTNANFFQIEVWENRNKRSYDFSLNNLSKGDMVFISGDLTYSEGSNGKTYITVSPYKVIGIGGKKNNNQTQQQPQQQNGYGQQNGFNQPQQNYGQPQLNTNQQNGFNQQPSYNQQHQGAMPGQQQGFAQAQQPNVNGANMPNMGAPAMGAPAMGAPAPGQAPTMGAPMMGAPMMGAPRQ